MTKINHRISCREAAYLSYLNALREEKYISDSLLNWKSKETPSDIDYCLAQEIAFGTCQRTLTLEYYANQLVEKPLKLKKKERALLYTALYQYFFLERIPHYALTNESMQIAKKHCHTTFSKFLNAILRKLANTKIQLPNDESIRSLSIRYSYPEYYIEKLLNDYGKKITLDILEAENTPSKTLARERNKTTLKPFPNEAVNVVYIESKDELLLAGANPDLYIQNITPVLLFANAAKKILPPESVLDLCSSPGGKLILSHDTFQNAKLFANDVSEYKLKMLRENLKKYEIDATITCGSGEKYPSDRLFDLIILDVPCSNSGVLNKRPEARWRQSKPHYEELEEIQNALLEHARKFLSPQGHLLYMTCSILKCENEEIVEAFSKKHAMKIISSETIIPSVDGYDGGFAALLTH